MSTPGWVGGFYEAQFELLPRDPAEPVQALQKARLAMLAARTPDTNRRILELGAGAGQFAVAAALAGYDVTAIELVSRAAEAAASAIARAGVASRARVTCGDFYTLTLARRFDAICYWDGFGIGSDSDQVRLLGRIEQWLRAEGVALIEVYTPWYWAGAAGRVMALAAATRRYTFDARGCRMLDTWTAHHGDTVGVQSLRCYSPADLELLLAGVGLELVHVQPGGAEDRDTGVWRDHVPLGEAMSFVACLRRTTRAPPDPRAP